MTTREVAGRRRHKGGPQPPPEPDIRTLRVDGIVIDLRLQVRAETCRSTVNAYRDAMKAGAEFPAVLVTPIDDQDLSRGFVLLDGFHRFKAQVELGATSVRAEVVFGVPEEARRWAGVERNRRHGLRYTRGERREQFRAYIEAGQHKLGKHGIKSSRQMAKELDGIVGDRRIPVWMKEDFPSAFRKMVERNMVEQPEAYFGKKDMDTILVTAATANLNQFIAALRGVRSRDLRVALARMVEKASKDAGKLALGGKSMPPVEVDDNEF